MNNEEVKDKIKEIIKKALEDRVDFDRNIKDDEALVALLGINSIKAIEIIVRLENEFDIEVEDEDLSVDFLSDVEGIADYIIARMA